MADRAVRPACGSCAKRAAAAAAAKQAKEKAAGEKVNESSLLNTKPAGRS